MGKFYGIRPPRKGPLPFRYVLLISFVFFMFSTAFGLWVVNAGIEPTLLKYAELEIERVATIAINKAVDQKLVEGIDVEKLIIIHKDNNNEIALVNPDTAMVNKVQSEVTNLVHKYLKLAEAGKLDELENLSESEIEQRTKLSPGIIREVPLGQATGMALLGNLGPKIPVKFTTVGEGQTQVVIETKDLGINNSQMYISIHVIVNIQVIIPFATEITKVERTIPIGAPLIQGKVPEFYNNGGDGASPSIDISPD
ncbi:sporulation protein YunB [Bacillus sp. DJP31]|uniref:sporulation protein YunB n=1 Tax=Bacillus sp. DJP31 TaxID=3409789 RepID=UPI003BB5CAB6